MRIGIIKEGKIPIDTRVPLIPDQCQWIAGDPDFDFSLVVESSDLRCFTDREYQASNVPVVSAMHNCDILLGVKEVPVDQLIGGKTYFFFSHTIKEQPHNRNLLKVILEKRIRLIDYEMLTDEKDNRVIAFGKFAGMVGAHNAVWAYGKRTSLFSLPRMRDCREYAEVKSYYSQFQFPALKIVLTGKGRVANGAASVLADMGIQQVPPDEYLLVNYNKPVFTQIDVDIYAKHPEGKHFTIEEFFKDPSDYESAFLPFAKQSDIMINGIYWDTRAPAFFTKEEMNSPEFRIRTIADVTCDIAPESSIPSTLRATTIEDPVFGYDPVSEGESSAYQPNVIDMMTIDNLPNELPRDASHAFGELFIEHVLPEINNIENSKMLKRATITQDGKLTERYQYLNEYVGKTSL